VKKDILYLLISSIAFSSAGIFIRLLETINIWNLIFFRLLFSTIFLGVAFLPSSHFSFEPGTKKTKFILSMFCYSILQILGTIIFFTLAIISGTVSETVILFFTFPIFSLLFARIFLKEKISFLKSFGVFFGFFGAILVIFESSNNGLEFSAELRYLNAIFAILSSICWALGTTISKSLSNRIEPKLMTVWGFAISVTIAFSLALINSNPIESLFSFSRIQWLLLVIFGFVTGILSNLMFNVATKRVPVSTANGLLLAEPLAASLLAIIFLGEKVALNLVIGGIMILVSSFIIIRDWMPRKGLL
jgi:drug/metabolite transporter (DMT)-like permease